MFKSRLVADELSRVKQTITADHHPDPIRSAVEQMRWPKPPAVETPRPAHPRHRPAGAEEPNQ